jgi:hypothetical protein
MMSLTFNWVAIALSLTAAAPGVDKPGIADIKTAVGKIRRMSGDRTDGARISYRLRVVEIEGLEWRQAGFGRFSEVARRGPVTIWTASNHAAQPLIDRASKVVASPPRVTSFANAAAHFSSRTNRSLVTRVSWSDEEPKLSSEAIREGFAATIAGRKLDQGILVQVVIDDTEIRSVHDVKLSRSCPSSTCTADDAKGCPAKTGPGESACRQDSAPASTIQVPEVASQQVDGEWLIPNDGVLVVGLGVHTVGGKDGKAVVRERLMVLEAKSDPDVARTTLRRDPTPGNHFIPAPAPATIPAPVAPAPANPDGPIPTPAVPSRTLPQGIHADGTPAELPPLPEEAEPIEADDSAEPHGSPQHRPKAQSIPMPNPPKPDSREKSIDSQASTAGHSVSTGLEPSRRLPIGAQSLSIPASLDGWIKFVRARGMLITGCPNRDEAACDEACTAAD